MNKRVEAHQKELFFSAHFDEPGQAKSVLLRRVHDIAFFPCVPNWADPAVSRIVAGVRRLALCVA